MRLERAILCGVIALGLAACQARPQATVVPPIPSTEQGPLRRPAVAGSFYPGDPQELANLVDSLLEEWQPTPDRPIALVVPHAGYPYSGHVAAAAYAELRGQHYEAIILVGPNHYLEELTGVAIYPAGAFETPLGQVPVQAELARAILAAEPSFQEDPALHSQEHSLEVQLPFLQRALPGTPIVPILIGRPTTRNLDALARALTQVLAGREVLLIASSDLSHYPAYDDAVRVDQATLAAIATMDPDAFLEALDQEMAQGVPNLLTPACGEGAIAVVMQVALQLGADRVALLHYANSGEVPGGDRDRVVGYGAVKFWNSRQVQ